MQPVGELDQNDPNIPGHGQRHFLEVLRLLVFQAVEFYVGELADAVDQFRNFLAKLSTDVLFGNPGVFYGVMQQSGHQALVVHVHASENTGYRQRVGHIGLTAAADLAIMRLFGKEIGALDQLHLGVMQIAIELVFKAREGAVWANALNCSLCGGDPEPEPRGHIEQ